MRKADGTAKVIGVHCRLGVPGTAPVRARLRSSLTALCMAARDGTLAGQSADWDSRAALGVVLAAGGYPDTYAKGRAISGLADADSDDQKVFHAGTATDGDKGVTNGGRVLCVVGLGKSVGAAAVSAYQSVDKIHWEDVYSRRDIGHRAIARERR